MRRIPKLLVLPAILAALPYMTEVVQAADDLLITAVDPSKSVSLLVNGVETPLPPTSPNGVMTLALGGALASALDPTKTYVLYRRECSGYVIVIEGTDDDRRCRQDTDTGTARTDRSEADTRCNRCLAIVGVIDRGVWKPATSSGTAGPQTTPPTREEGGRFTIEAFGFGSGAWGRFTNVGSARDVIDTRFSTTTPPYNQPRLIDIDDKSTGFSLGGGVNVGVGRWLDIRALILRESERDSPAQSVAGEAVNGLRFEQQGSSEVRSTTLMIGAALRMPGGITVTGGPALTRWRARLRQTGRLQAGCPNACMVVRTDDVTEESDGTDVGLYVGAEYYPGNRWIGTYLSYLRTTYHDASDPSRALAWPRDWKDSNFFAGVVVRTPRWR